MRFSVLQQDLNRGLGIVSRAVPGRTTRPILTNICLASDQGRLRLFATDEEMGIAAWIQAAIHEEGSTAIPAKLLCDVVGYQQPGSMEFTVTAGDHASQAVRVKSQRSNANLRGFDPTEFPLVPGGEGSEPPVLLDAALLKEMLGEVLYAAGTDPQWPVFTGILVQVRGNSLVLVGADRQRVAVRKAVLAGDAGERKDILVPAQTLGDLIRILPAQGTVEMAVTPRGSQVVFKTDQLQLSSRLLEGNYPDFQRIIPQEYVTRAVLATKTFASVVREVLPFSQANKNVVVLSLSGGGAESLGTGTLTLEATAQDLGDGTSSVAANVDGPDQRIIYDVRYLVDALEVIKTPEVAIELTSEERPGVIRPIGSALYMCVITPLTRNAAQSAASKTEAPEVETEVEAEVAAS
jgi:DNA polymerase III subunit beta